MFKLKRIGTQPVKILFSVDGLLMYLFILLLDCTNYFGNSCLYYSSICLFSFPKAKGYFRWGPSECLL